MKIEREAINAETKYPIGWSTAIAAANRVKLSSILLLGDGGDGLVVVKNH